MGAQKRAALTTFRRWSGGAKAASGDPDTVVSGL